MHDPSQRRRGSSSQNQRKTKYNLLTSDKQLTISFTGIMPKTNLLLVQLTIPQCTDLPISRNMDYKSYEYSPPFL